jgi:hypothetical protein
MGMYPAGIVIKPSITVDTSAYAAGDLLFDKVELKNAVPSRGGASIIENITMYNEDGVAAEDFLVLFFDNETSIGVNANDAITGISHAEFKASGFIGACELNGGESGHDVGTGFIIQSGNNDKGPTTPILVQAASNTRSIWVAVIVTTDTPDYSSASDGCKMTFNIKYLG